MALGLPLPNLVDRDHEMRELRALATAGEPKLALLTGRRRVGKTYLLMHTWQADEAFFFTAARTSPEINRQQLLTDFAAWSGEPIEPADHPTWRSTFLRLFDHPQAHPLVLVIDEFQYLADDERGLAQVASELNAAWERRRTPRSLLLVLAGSAVQTMEALSAGGSPLYGRFHWRHRLPPFDYWHAAELAPFASARARIQAYVTLGGIPRYLSALNTNVSVEANIARLSLSPRGEVRRLVETALDQEDGLREVSTYRAILRAVATGQTRRNEIAQRVGIGNDAALRDKLTRLIDLGYLRTRTNFDAPPNAPIAYEVADPAVRFHHRYVEPNLSLLDREDARDVWNSVIAPTFDSFVGLEFERVATEAYDRLRSVRNYPMVKRWSRWEGADRAGEPIEIDVVAELTDGRVMTGSVKWNQHPLETAVHYRHLAMLERAAAAGRAWAHAALAVDAPLLYVSAAGFDAGFAAATAASRHPVITLSLDDFFSPELA